MYNKDKNMIWDTHKMMLVLLMLVSTILEAQNLSVSSFKLLENDLAANTYGTMVKDRNGEVSALIKIVTVERGFAFDGGMAGIVDTKQEVGEVWVYVPHGIKKITIKHPQLGVLRDYFFDIPIEKARTYEMVLSTGQIKRNASHALNKQFVVFEVKPADAVVELNGEVLNVDSEGYATKSMPFGTYDYSVSCANYHTVEGKVTVNAQGKAEVKVELRSNKSVQENDTLAQSTGLANITLKTDKESEIWVDGERKEKGEWTGTLEMGNYMVEVRREAHRTTSEMVQIQGTEARTIYLESPTPMYGLLEISSNPMRVTVYVDDKEVGETPLMLSNIPVGEHHILFRKEGFKPIEEIVTVRENTENRLSVNLEKNQVEVATKKFEEKELTPEPVKKDKTPNKRTKLKYMVGIEAKTSEKYSSGTGYGIGLGYGGEVGIALNSFSLITGVESHIIGKYATLDNDGGNLKEHTVQLLRFSTKLGYTLGRRFQFTPQVGIVFGPSFLTGEEYVMNELDVWTGGSSLSDKFLADRDYTGMNQDIIDFAKMRCGVLVASRLEYRFRVGLGIHVTPEYVFGEGAKVSAGLTFKF